MRLPLIRRLPYSFPHRAFPHTKAGWTSDRRRSRRGRRRRFAGQHWKTLFHNLTGRHRRTWQTKSRRVFWQRKLEPVRLLKFYRVVDFPGIPLEFLQWNTFALWGGSSTIIPRSQLPFRYLTVNVDSHEGFHWGFPNISTFAMPTTESVGCTVQ